MKIIYWIIAIVVVVGAVWAYQHRAVEPAPADTTDAPADTSTLSRSGRITTIDTKQAAVDGPVLVTITGPEGVSVIAVPSFGLLLCEAYKAGNIADVYTMKVGQEISVAGALSEDGSIVPCSSADHYLRML